MFCRNCGEILTETEVVCRHCGFALGTGSNFCEQCGTEAPVYAIVCEVCGTKLEHSDDSVQYQGQYAQQMQYAQQVQYAQQPQQSPYAQQPQPYGNPAQAQQPHLIKNAPSQNFYQQQSVYPNPTQQSIYPAVQQPQYVTRATNGRKSKAAAALLGFLLGSLGIHDFYLGNHVKGIIHLGMSLTGGLSVVSWIWAVVETIQMLSSPNPTDANNNPLD